MHPKQTTRVSSDTVKEVGLAEDFQRDVFESSVIEFEDEDLKEKILESEDEEMLIITSSINSPKTVEEVVRMNELEGEEFSSESA